MSEVSRSASTNNSSTPPLSAREAAAYIGVKVKTLYDYVAQREIGCWKYKGLLRFSKADLDAFMERRRQPSWYEEVR